MNNEELIKEALERGLVADILKAALKPSDDDNFVEEALERGLVADILEAGLEKSKVETGEIVKVLTEWGFNMIEACSEEEIEGAYKEAHPEINQDWSDIIRQAGIVAHYRGSSFGLFEQVQTLKDGFAKIGLHCNLAVINELES